MQGNGETTSGKPATGASAQPFSNRRTHRLLRWLTRVVFAGMIDMDFRTVRRHVILLVAVAFELVILFDWWSAVFDLPHLLYGAEPSDFRWQEPLAQTVWLLLLLFFVVLIIIVFFKQIRYLEGFLPVCSFCKSIRAGEEWVPLERYMQEHSALKLTHSLCPSCAKQHYDYDEADEKAAATAQGEGAERDG